MSRNPETLSPVTRPSSLMNEHIWRGIDTGVYKPMTPATARKMVDAIWQTHPLVSLSQTDEASLKEYYTSYVLQHGNRTMLQKMTGPVVLVEHPYVRLYMNGIDVRDFPTLLVGATAQKAFEAGYPAMTKEQKHDILSNPDSYLHIEIKEKNVTDIGMASYGNRTFFVELQNSEFRDASYGHTKENFLERAHRIAERIGSNTLHILDMGGGIGLGMHDIKTREKNGEFGDLSFRPTIITAEEELVIWEDAGEFIIGPAERLPHSLKDTQAIAVSNRAFEYFCYPDVALKNVVNSLIPGGEMCIMFDYRRSPLARLEEQYDPEYLSYFPTIHYTGRPLTDRVRNVYAWLRKMETKEYIRIIQLTDDETDREFPPAGPIEIEKLQSIPDVEFLPEV